MARLLYGGYGHNPRGKQYVYWGGDNYRTGQNVVAPVTDPITGKTYRTMFTIRRTSAGEMGQNEAKRLEAQGIDIKSVEGRDVLSLPSGSEYSSASQWKRESDERYNRLLQDRSRYLSRTSTASSGWNRSGTVYRQGWDETRAIFMRRFRI